MPNFLMSVDCMTKREFPTLIGQFTYTDQFAVLHTGISQTDSCHLNSINSTSVYLIEQKAIYCL